MLPGHAMPAFPAGRRMEYADHGPSSRRNPPVARFDEGFDDVSSPRLRAVRETEHPYGLPWQIVSPSQTLVTIGFHYSSESDRGPYPLSASTRIETRFGPACYHGPPVDVLAVRALRYAVRGRRTSMAGSGAIWNLESDAVGPVDGSRRRCWTSDLPRSRQLRRVLLRLDESRHPFHRGCTQTGLRLAGATRGRSELPVLPADGSTLQALCELQPSGPSGCAAMCQTVITTMKTYGLILADNGSNWYFQGMADTRRTTPSRPAEADPSESLRRRRRILSDGDDQLGRQAIPAWDCRLHNPLRMTESACPDPTTEAQTIAFSMAAPLLGGSCRLCGFIHECRLVLRYVDGILGTPRFQAVPGVLFIRLGHQRWSATSSA